MPKPASIHFACRPSNPWRCCALALLALTACDDEGGGIDSGVDGNKELSELSSAEASDLCDAVEEYTESALSERVYERHACVLVGLAEGEGEVEACRRAQSACESGQLDGGDFPGGLPITGLRREEAQCLSSSQLNGCDATVAELESCYEALIGQRLRELYAPRCESLASGQGPIVDEPAQPPVCVSLQAKCSLPPLLTQAPIVIEPPDFDAGPIDPPDPPVLTPGCEDLSLGFDGTDCASEGCDAQVECDCDPFTQSFSTCNQVFGCLSSIDCEAACELGLGSVYSCADDVDCDSDADCNGYYCVDDGFSGECSRGEPGQPCEDAGDCASGTCSALSFSMTCAGTAPVGDPCTTDADCASSICYFDFAVSSTEGTCSSGGTGEPCSSDDECVDGSCAPTVDGSECSDGGDGAPCDDDFECDGGVCAYGGRGYATCADRSDDSPCDGSTDCASGNCETSSTTGESTCAPSVGSECDGGMVDCNLECRPSQGSCASALCIASCDGGSCSGETLAAWSTVVGDFTGSIIVTGSDDLTASTSANGEQVRATLGATSGRFYWEIAIDAQSITDGGGIGVTSEAATLGTALGSSTVPGVVFAPTGEISNSDGDTLTGCGYAAGDVVGVALDLDDEVIYFSVNGLWQAGGSPDDAEGGIGLDLGGETVRPALELWSGDVYTANFGQATFAFPPPDGYGSLY